MYCHALHKKIINAGRILRLSFVKCRVDRLYLCLILYYNSDIFEIAIISTAIFYLGYMQIVALHSMYRHILTIKKEFRTFSSSDRLRAKFVFYFILFNIYPSQNIYAAYLDKFSYNYTYICERSANEIDERENIRYFY